MVELSQFFITVREIRCPRCHKLLCKVVGYGAVIEIVCPRSNCHTLVRWPGSVPEIVQMPLPIMDDLKGAVRPVGDLEGKSVVLPLLEKSHVG